jgi:hypothetical protein
VERPQLPHRRGRLLHDVAPLGALRRRHPGEDDSPRVDPNELDQVAEQREPPSRVFIALLLLELGGVGKDFDFVF